MPAPFFVQQDPRSQYRLDLARQLIAQGGDSSPVQHPVQGLSRIAQALSGAFIARNAMDRQEARQGAAQKTVADALAGFSGGEIEPGTGARSTGTGDIGALARALAANPDTAPLGLQVQIQSSLADARRAGSLADAKELATFRAGLKAKAAESPSAVREFQFFNSLSPEDQQRFLLVKRANPYLNLGDVFAQPDPLNPGSATGTLPVGVAPKTAIQDDRVVVAPAVPGAGRGGNMMVGGGGRGVPTPDQPAAPVVSDLPPSPTERREIAEAEAQTAARNEQKATFADVVTQDIDRIKDIVKNADIPVTGAGSFLSVIPGTAAHDASKLLDTIKANAGFDRLQQMREQSPTGGALGQVSEFENRLLQATIGNLEMSQSEDQFLQNLDRVQKIYEKIIHKGIKPGDPLAEGVASAGAPAGGIKFLGFE